MPRENEIVKGKKEKIQVVWLVHFAEVYSIIKHRYCEYCVCSNIIDNSISTNLLHLPAFYNISFHLQHSRRLIIGSNRNDNFINFSLIDRVVPSLKRADLFHRDHNHPRLPIYPESRTEPRTQRENVTPIRRNKPGKQSPGSTNIRGNVWSGSVIYERMVVNAFNRVRNVSSLTSGLHATQKRFYLSSFWNVQPPSPSQGTILHLPLIKTQITNPAIIRSTG